MAQTAKRTFMVRFMGVLSEAGYINQYKQFFTKKLAVINDRLVLDNEKSNFSELDLQHSQNDWLGFSPFPISDFLYGPDN
jgi:hypothetical protein